MQDPSGSRASQPRLINTAVPLASRSGVTTWKPAMPSSARLSTKTVASGSNSPRNATRSGNCPAAASSSESVCKLIAFALPARSHWHQTQFLLLAAAGLPIAEQDCDARECHTDRDGEPDSAGGIAAHCQRRWDNAAAAGLSDMRVIIILAFIGIIVSLGSALVFLVRDRGGSSRTVHALTVRVGLSVALFLFILFSYWMGWIEPRSY